MDLFSIGSILLYIGIGIMLLGSGVRLILSATYIRRNGSRTLTDDQRSSLRKAIIPIRIVAILVTIASLVCFTV